MGSFFRMRTKICKFWRENPNRGCFPGLAAQRSPEVTVDKPVARGAEPGRNPPHPKAPLSLLGQLWSLFWDNSSWQSPAAVMWLCHQEMEALSCCTTDTTHFTCPRENSETSLPQQCNTAQGQETKRSFSPQGLNNHFSPQFFTSGFK